MNEHVVVIELMFQFVAYRFQGAVDVGGALLADGEQLVQGVRQEGAVRQARKRTELGEERLAGIITCEGQGKAAIRQRNDAPRLTPW